MKALYRKYRPKTLSEVVGQEKITNLLDNAIKNKSFSHAYLFTGPRGTGKTSVARIFAHEINNFTYELEDNYVDIIEIDAASNTGVDNIRDLKERALVAPTKGKYKVYIIDEVHMLSKSAFNALLKILEEPPKHVIFLLATTDIQKVPITITSRVQKLVFSLADKETMFKHLKNICEKEKINIEDDAIKIIVKRGGGSFRDSLSLLDQISNLSKEKITKDLVEKTLGLPQEELIEELIEKYTQNDLQSISSILKQILNSGIKPETLTEEIINRIIEEPKAELLPLLSKLPEVKAPFSEAKLLLAFTTFSEDSLILNKNKHEFLPKNSPIIKQSTSKIEKSNDENSEKSETTVKENTLTSVKKTQDVTLNSSEFNWENFVKNISSKLLKPQVEKCRHILDGNTLKLYPETNASLNILSSPNNLKAIKKCLPASLELSFFEPKEYPKKLTKNKNHSTINDIMGETQEVKNDGEIPF